MENINWVSKQQNIHLLEEGNYYFVTEIGCEEIDGHKYRGSPRVSFRFYFGVLDMAWADVTAFCPTPYTASIDINDIQNFPNINPSRIIEWRNFNKFEATRLTGGVSYLTYNDRDEMKADVWIGSRWMNGVGKVLAYCPISSMSSKIDYSKYYDPPEIISDIFDLENIDMII